MQTQPNSRQPVIETVEFGAGGRGWRPVSGIPVEMQKTSDRRSGLGVWHEGRLALSLPTGLTRKDERRILGLLVWGALGRGLKPAAERLAALLNEQYFRRPLTGVGFRHQLSRWGSCSAGWRIHLSHRLLVAPSHLFEAVLLHELAHLGCLNHGAEFWRALAAADPLCKRHRIELATYGNYWAGWWDNHLRDLLRHGRTILHPPIV